MSLSIQSRVTVALTCAAMVLSAATGTLLYRAIGAEMAQNFDRGLQTKGQAIVSLVSLEPGGVLDFEFNEAAMPEYRPGKAAEYFQIRFADGRDYSRAKSLGQLDLWFGPTEARDGEGYYDLRLPSGRNGRAIRIGFVPQSELPPPAPAAPMVAVIARDRGELDNSLRSLLRSLIAASVLLAAATATASIWIVRRALQPLRRVAEQAAAIDASRLQSRLSESGLPPEVAPICQRLNDLLSRLERAFERERRFTSDVAHELRTPIAELRTIAEIALAWPEDPGAAHGAVADALAIAIQMQTLVTTLLSLVRADKKGVQIMSQPVPLAAMTRDVVARQNAAMPIRPFELSIDESIAVLAEPALLKSVLINLISNALEYSTGDQPVHCRASAANDHVQLVIDNQTSTLTDADVPHLFDPFWRKEASRTGASHAGLGLSLVKAYCDLMGIEIAAALKPPSTLRMSLTFTSAIGNVPVAPPSMRISLPANSPA